MRNIYYNEKNVELDDGLIFGRGVFETILVKEKPILFLEHINRLNNAIEVLKIGDKVDRIELLHKIKELKIRDKGLKILVTKKNIIISERDIPYKKDDYIRGFKVKLSNVIRNSTSLLTYVKSINYIENLIENEKAKEEGYNEVIFLNENGFVTEGSTSNIFSVKDGIIYTPKIECGLLNGILRGFIIDNFNVIEREMKLKELLESDEVFITNSLVGIMKVTSINGNLYIENNIANNDNIYMKNNITEKIIAKYKEYIEENGGY